MLLTNAKLLENVISWLGEDVPHVIVSIVFFKKNEALLLGADFRGIFRLCVKRGSQID